MIKKSFKTKPVGTEFFVSFAPIGEYIQIAAGQPKRQLSHINGESKDNAGVRVQKPVGIQALIRAVAIRIRNISGEDQEFLRKIAMRRKRVGSFQVAKNAGIVRVRESFAKIQIGGPGGQCCRRLALKLDSVP